MILSAKQPQSLNIINTTTTMDGNCNIVMSKSCPSFNFKNEGNSHLVLGVGDTGTVLRLVKREAGGKQQSEMEAVARFSNLVMRPVLGPFLPPVQVLQLSPEQLEAASSVVSASTGRGVDLSSRRALLMEDALALPPPPSSPASPVLSVELRIKYCALGNDTEGRLCNSCHQMSQKRRSPGFSYCPYELFSGDRARMVRALRRLLATPDKYLMVFLAGRLVTTEQCEAALRTTLGRPALLPALVAELLLTPPSPGQDLVLDMDTGDQGDQQQEKEERRMCDTSSSEAPLPAGSILATLQAAQRGSSMSAQEAEQVFLSLMEDGSLDYDSLMERISGAEAEDGRRLPAEVEAGVRRLQSFSMATTSNGVSVVVSLRRDEEGQGGDGGSGGWVVVNGARFRYKLSLIDIELKPLASKPDQGNKLQFIKRGCKKYSKLCKQLSRQLSRQISTQMANHISLSDVPRFQIGFFLAFLAAVVLLGALVYESSKFF